MTRTLSNLRPAVFAALLALFAVVALLPAARAHAASDIAERTRIFLEDQALPGDIEIVVGDIDPRLQLAECRRYEPFVPPGARLWGRATLGVRCVEGATWTAYVPVQIRVFAPVHVAARPIARGTALTAADVRTERVDLTRFPGGVLGTDEAIEGKAATRAIAAGEPLKRGVLRAPRLLEPGDAVRIVYDAPGFAVSIEGKALSAAGDGESARVALVNGRVLTGIARPGKVVEVK